MFLVFERLSVGTSVRRKIYYISFFQGKCSSPQKSVCTYIRTYARTDRRLFLFLIYLMLPSSWLALASSHVCLSVCLFVGRWRNLIRKLERQKCVCFSSFYFLPLPLPSLFCGNGRIMTLPTLQVCSDLICGSVKDSFPENQAMRDANRIREKQFY